MQRSQGPRRPGSGDSEGTASCLDRPCRSGCRGAGGTRTGEQGGWHPANGSMCRSQAGCWATPWWPLWAGVTQYVHTCPSKGCGRGSSRATL